jgi:hypothetical protein
VFAFFGLGTQELLLLGLVAVMVTGVVLVLLWLRSAGGAGTPGGERVAELEEENRRLRAELDRERRGPSGPPPAPPV